MRGVARRYARALVSYSVENGVDLDGMIANLKSVVDFLGKNVDIKRYLLSPIISRSEKLEFAKELFGKLNLPDYLVNFCLLLVEKDRLGIFDLVYEEVVDEVDRRNNRVRGTLKLATEVDRDMVESIRKVFEEKLNKEVLFNVVVDPSIIGGVVVEIGGYVFDGSIMKSLEQLREKMIEG